MNKTKDDQTQDELMTSFTQTQDKNEVVEVLKELFDAGKIKLISDVDPDEIRLITRINAIAEMKNLDVWQKVVNEYMSLLLSKNRRSRYEIIDAIKGYQMRQQGGLSRLLPTNWGGRNR